MSILREKQNQARERQKFAHASKRSAFIAVLVLLLGTAIIAIIALSMFYGLSCDINMDVLSERAKVVEQFSLTQSVAGGCVTKPRNDTDIDMYLSTRNDSIDSVVYMLGDGEVKSWQYVGDSPIYLFHHDGGILGVHLLDADGNYTMKKLGGIKSGSDAMLMVELPPFHWHAWKPTNLFPYTVFSVVTAAGVPDITEHPLVDVTSDPVLSRLANASATQEIVNDYSESSASEYCLTTS